MTDNALTYQDFLATKQRLWTGESIAEVLLPPRLKPFQVDLARWALRKGRCALWCDTGLGKTAMQLAWGDQIRRAGGRVLILAPLAVTTQTAREGEKFGVPVQVCREAADVVDDALNVTNYQRLDHIDPKAFDAVVLDESSILKAFMGATKRALLDAFAETRYKLCCTATPAPNDYLELGNHAEFLGVMRANEMIMRWFTNDPMEAGNYRLKPHGAEAFWRWVASWAMSVTKPSDIGHADEGFALPPLSIIECNVGAVDVAPTDGHLFVMPDVSATALHATLRASAPARAAEVARLVAAEPEEPWLLWVYTDYDAEAVKAVVGDLVEVRGPDSPDVKAERLLGFADGRIPRLLTKPGIAGMGLNLQVCARQVFVGLNFSFESFYQAVRRCWRYGQTREVKAFVVFSENEAPILTALREKTRQHEVLTREMIAASRAAVAAELHAPPALIEASVVDAAEAEDGRWRLLNGDCVDVCRSLPADSVDFSMFSPPFSNLYVYSDRLADMGNSADHDEFFRHFGFLIAELYRITVPGRLCSVHCKDLPLYKTRDGAAGLYDFPAMTTRAFEAAGWIFHSRVTIWKDPVIEMQRTKNHGLLYKQLRKDSCASRQGMADYVLTFRKWAGLESADAPKPVGHEREDFPLDQWQRWASPVWSDIQQTRVLQYQQARDDEDERHICPLQLDVIERCVTLWSNPGDLVFSPFAGIGSEGYEAVRLGRRFLGVELKPSYWRIAARNLRLAATLQSQGSLFAADVAVESALS
jgi:DNA modification methylase